jgi:hypothetical protein
MQGLNSTLISIYEANDPFYELGDTGWRLQSGGTSSFGVCFVFSSAFPECHRLRFGCVGAIRAPLSVYATMGDAKSV